MNASICLTIIICKAGQKTSYVNILIATWIHCRFFYISYFNKWFVMLTWHQIRNRFTAINITFVYMRMNIHVNDINSIDHIHSITWHASDYQFNICSVKTGFNVLSSIVYSTVTIPKSQCIFYGDNKPILCRRSVQAAFTSPFTLS